MAVVENFKRVEEESVQDENQKIQNNHEETAEEIDVVADGGVKKRILKDGKGDKPLIGHQVEVHYVGRLTNGKEFDSSISRKKPFTFVLGNGEVIKGWELGVAQMRVGEKSILTISPEYAYGATGAGDSIPPNSTIIFEVELLSSKKPPKPKWQMNFTEKMQIAKDKKNYGSEVFNKKEDDYLYNAIQSYKESLDYIHDVSSQNENEKNEINQMTLSLHLNLSLCYYKSGLYTDAINSASQALKIDANSSKAYYRRALAFMIEGSLDDAKKDLIAANNIEQNKNAEILKSFVKCEEMLKKQKELEKKKFRGLFNKINLYDDKSN